MRHISCDLCGKDLVTGSQLRYIVKLDVRLEHNATYTAHEHDFPIEDDTDSVEAMNQLLEDIEHDSHADVSASDRDTVEMPSLQQPPLACQYDLCTACYQRFQQDPLGRERKRKLHFSSN